MIERGFYIIKEKFFEEINDPFLKINKAEKRPHYYCFKEEKTGLLWMIPLSSKIDKYKYLMNKKQEEKGYCDTIHIAKLANRKESAFLIQDMFPITKKYIDRKYTIASNPLVLNSEHLAKEIENKAKKVMRMLKGGVKFTPTQPDIKRIIKFLEDE